MQRRSLLKSGLAMALGPAADGPLAKVLTHVAPGLPMVERHAVGVRVGRPEIARLGALAEGYEMRGMVAGGGVRDDGGEVLRAALVHVHEGQAMAREARCPDELLPELLDSVAWLQRAAGFMAFDAGAYPLADELLDGSADLAAASGNQSLAARVDGTRARVASWRGDQPRAIDMTRKALRENSRLVPIERSMLHAMQARAHGLAGDADACRTEIDLSDLAMDEAQPGDVDEQRPWARSFSFAHQQGDTGRALLDLAAAVDDPTFIPEATARQQTAANGHNPAEVLRSVALSHLSLAAGSLVAGAPDTALAHGTHALGAATALESRRVVEDMRQVRAMCLDQCPGNADAIELNARLGVALVTRDERNPAGYGPKRWPEPPPLRA